MREFETGAIRDSSDSKIDYDGFFSPLVFEAFGEYMHGHRKQADGKLRASDNWQKGIPKEEYRKSMWRHFVEFWAISRGWRKGNIVDELCGVMFNAMGYLHEVIKERMPVTEEDVFERARRICAERNHHPDEGTY